MTPSFIIAVVNLLTTLVTITVGTTNVTVTLQRQECRIAGYMLPKENYLSYTCGLCFYYSFLQGNKQYENFYFIQRCLDGILICDKRQLLSSTETGSSVGENTTSYLRATSADWCNCANKEVVYNLPEYSNNSVNLDTLIMEPKLPSDYLTLTRDCCSAAKSCCDTMLQETDVSTVTRESENGTIEPECPHTWDGWNCWPRTRPGVLRGSCPHYTYGGDWTSNPATKRNLEEYYSSKTCMSDGTWYKNPRYNSEWTDYSKCATLRMKEEVVKHFVGITAFAISVIAVVPAIIIFSAYRSLQVDRITIHKHLLFSFFLTGIMYIFNNIFFVADDAYGAPLVDNNHISCRLLFLVQLRYLRLANYMWMLCEGLYLYKFLFDAFAENRSLFVYYLLGWVFPIIPTVAYAVLRTELDNDKCWIISNIGWIEWSTFGPCILSLAVNFVLMVFIMRELITKLRQGNDNEPAQYRKAVRATLLLLPMFGLHFFITIYRHHNLWYEIVNKLLDGLQGFIVAVIICYTHGEVLDLLKKTWRVHRMQQTCDREMRRSKKSFHVEQANSTLL